MNRVIRARRFAAAFAAAALLSVAHPVSAQEIAEGHLKAAREAVDAINATDPYDNILPAAAQALKNELIQKNPDLESLIIQTVDEQALKMAPRRGDLEREAALAYARVFSEQQLNDIAGFYNSETGKKLLADGPIVTRELIRAAQIWQNGLARDLAQAVGESLQKQVPQAQVQPAAPAAAEQQPAEGGASN